MMKAKVFYIFFLCLLYNCKDKLKPNAGTIILQKECIANILKEDDSLGTIRNHACDIISLNKTIEQYVNSVRKLNFKNCPENFKQAFENHMTAWEDMGEFTNNYAELRGEMHDLFDEIEKRKDSASFKHLLKNIWDTWATIETINSESDNN